MAAKKKASTKPKTNTDIVQGSDAWRNLRSGKVTASRITDVMDYKKNGDESAARAAYRTQIVTEMLTGVPFDYAYETPAMRWGREQEPFARLLYGQLRGVEVQQIAFAPHEALEHAGASPDGLVGPDGLLEIKCPMSHTHLAYCLAGAVVEDYKLQMLWQLACMPERKWVDFVSFDPRVGSDLAIFIRRFHRDAAAEQQIKHITEEVKKFIGECQDAVKKLKALTPEYLYDKQGA